MLNAGTPEELLHRVREEHCVVVHEHGGGGRRFLEALAVQDDDRLRLLHTRLHEVAHPQDGPHEEDGPLRLKHLHEAHGGRRRRQDDDRLVAGQERLPQRPQERHDLRPGGAARHHQRDEGGVGQDLLGLPRLPGAQEPVHGLRIVVVSEVGVLAQAPPVLAEGHRGPVRPGPRQLARAPLGLHLVVPRQAELHDPLGGRRLDALGRVLPAREERDAPVAQRVREGRARLPAARDRDDDLTLGQGPLKVQDQAPVVLRGDEEHATCGLVVDLGGRVRKGQADKQVADEEAVGRVA
mmetsp:Transcript_77174/g.239027  ORF Transcript_77174/g.239027 Transcript_77174/m.239027 type:complete len:295 (+) Transcript_77174:398-1282(+)